MSLIAKLLFSPYARWGGVWLVVMVIAVGCEHAPGRPDPARRFVRPEQVVDFERLFDQNCRGCHGQDGKGGPAPPLNDPLFLAIVPDEELDMAITFGRSGYLMPAFGDSEGGPLTSEQIALLVEGIRRRWAKPTPQEPLPSYLKEKEEKGNREAGAKVFETACAGCHGHDGKGGKLGSVNDPRFLALLSDQALRRIVITGRPDLGMPDYASEVMRSPHFKPLTSQDIADVTALLSAWRKGK